MKFSAFFLLVSFFVSSCSISPTAPVTATNVVNNYAYTNYWDPAIRTSSPIPFLYIAALLDSSGNPVVEMSAVSSTSSPYSFVPEGTYYIGYRFVLDALTVTTWMSNPTPVYLTNRTAYNVLVTTTATNNTDFVFFPAKTVVSLVRVGSINDQGGLY